MDVIKLLSSSNYLCVNVWIAKELSPNAAILLSLLCRQYEYWREKDLLSNGYFYITRENIYNKSGLTEDMQRSSEKLLINKKLISQKRMGIPATNHYIILEDNLLNFLYNLYPEQDIGECHNYKNPPQQDIGECHNKMSENRTQDNNNTNNKEINKNEGMNELNITNSIQNNILKSTGIYSEDKKIKPPRPPFAETQRYKPLKELISGFSDNERVQDELKTFTDTYLYTHKIKLSSPRFEKMLDRLKELSGGDENKMIKIVGISIERGWKSFFALPEDDKDKKKSYRTKADDQSYEDYNKARENIELARDENGDLMRF